MTSQLTLCSTKFNIDPEDYALDVDAKLTDDILKAKQTKITAQLQAVALNDAHLAVKGMADTRFGGDYNRAVQAFLTNSDLRAGRPSVEFSILATTQDAKRELSSMADGMFKSMWKRFIGKGELDSQLNDDVFLALHGVAPQSPEATQISRAFRDIAEKLRVEFNKAGGAIRKLDDWGMPQKHIPRKMMGGMDLRNRLSLAQADIDAPKRLWVDFVMPRLDRARMLDNTGSPLSDKDLRTLLEKTFEKILFDGDRDIDIEKLKLPSGKRVAKAHADHRVLHFASPEKSLEYAKEYGTENVVETMVSHIDMMARDLALIREMGPNPEMTYQTLRRAAMKMQDLEGGRWKSSSIANLDATWRSIKGFEQTGNPRVASALSNARTFVSTTRLGFATITSIPDIANGWATILFNGGSGGRYLLRRMQQLIPIAAKAGKKDAKRYGLLVDQTLNAMQAANKYTDDNLAGKMRLFSNAYYNFTLMTPFQAGQETAVRMSLLDTVGTIANRLDANLPLNKRQASFMKRYGIDHADMKELYRYYDGKTGMIALDQIDDEILRMKVNAAILEEGNYGAPNPTARSRAVTSLGFQGGSLAGEGARFVTQWKSFMIILNQTSLARVKNTALNRHDLGAGFNSGYIMAYLSSMTMLGMLSFQLKEIAKGREPAPMKTPSETAKIAMAGFIQSGAGGVFADYVFSPTNRYGKKFLESTLVPPTLQFADDILGNFLMTDFDTEEGAERWWENKLEKMDRGVANAIQSSVPFVNAWQTKLIWDQWVVRNVISEEQNDKRIRRGERVVEERGSDFWWRPDEALPGG